MIKSKITNNKQSQLPSFWNTGFNDGILSNFTRKYSSSVLTGISGPRFPGITTGIISFCKKPTY